MAKNKMQVSGWNDKYAEKLAKIGEHYRASGVNVAPPQDSRADEISDAAVIRKLIDEKYSEIGGE
jgi:hypothetical protein